MPTPGSMIIFDSRGAQFTRAARPTFASRAESPSTLLFVDAASKKSRAERRKIRAHIMHAIHEGKRREGVGKEGCDVPADANAIIRTPRAHSPFQEASFAGADPFDSLPVKTFSGMHDLLGYYFDNYPGAAPLTDDKLLRSTQKKGAARRVNTQWDIISSDETCMLALISALARIRASNRPDPKSLDDYHRLYQATLKSMRERMPLFTSTTKPPEGYIFAVMGEATLASMYRDEATAISHLRGAHELIRMRGGVDTLERLARRVISWCEYHSCAAHQLRPMLAPTPPPHGPWIDDGSIKTSSSPFPPELVALVSAAHARTAAHLPPTGPNHPYPPTTGSSSSSARTNDNAHLVSRIFAALTLVGAATSAAWQPAFQASGPAKEAAGAVLDDALHAMLVELARLEENDDDGRKDAAAASEDADDDDGAAWAHAVLLHAAHAYLWAALSDLPASPHMHAAFLARLRGALEGGGGRQEDAGAIGGGSGLLAGWMWRDGSGGGSGRAIVAAGPMDAETLMWVLAVGCFLADKRRAMYGGGEEMLDWFRDRIVELLRVVRVCDRGRAVEMVRDFPATDAFKMKWEGLLREERFCKILHDL